MNEHHIKNIAFYTFFKPTYDLVQCRMDIIGYMQTLGIKGTILLAVEGINCSLCGTISAMDDFLVFLFKKTGIQPPDIKISFSKTLSFKRALVKIKPFIVAKPGKTPIDPSQEHAPYVSPKEFHEWITNNKDMIILDTRNDYEYTLGHFNNALHFGTKHFSNFEEELNKFPQDLKSKPIVTFCTGGIRCEKAALLMLKKGFSNVYQLDGGVLNYFEKMGQGYYEGECFVFDERIAVGPTSQVKETKGLKYG